jgi:hypothetical protein
VTESTEKPYEIATGEEIAVEAEGCKSFRKFSHGEQKYFTINGFGVPIQV